MIENTIGIKSCTECPFYRCDHGHGSTDHICTAQKFMVFGTEKWFYLDSRLVDTAIPAHCPLRTEQSFRFLVDK